MGHPVPILYDSVFSTIVEKNERRSNNFERQCKKNFKEVFYWAVLTVRKNSQENWKVLERNYRRQDVPEFSIKKNRKEKKDIPEMEQFPPAKTRGTLQSAM